MMAKNRNARFATLVKDIHADRMAEYFRSDASEKEIDHSTVKVAFESHAGSSTLRPSSDRVHVRHMVLDNSQKTETLNLTRTFLVNDFEQLDDEKDTFRRPRFSTPSARAAKHLGVDGISCSYERVLGNQHQALWVRLYSDLEDRNLRQELYNALIEEYPELPRVKDYPAVWTVVLNCVQKIVPADIEHWLFGGRGGWYQEYLEHVMRLVGGRHLGWVPGISTLRKIEDVVEPRFRAEHDIYW
jgi:hypothetical protein